MQPNSGKAKAATPGKGGVHAGTTARQWTPSQQRGIREVGKSVLVSAAAGSGKTSVLAERCAHLVCDGPDRCNIDELLVVTFTEAAAAEMKGRIAAALAQRAASQPNDAHIIQQLALVDAAQVGTLHGFCNRLLRQYFHRLGIDPGFIILDEDEAAMMRIDVARDMLGEWFDREHDSVDFTALVDCYGDGDDERLVQIILHLHAMLSSLVDPAGWAERSLQRLREAVEKPLTESELGKEYLAIVRRDLEALRASCADAGKATAAQPQFAAYTQHLRELYSVITHWVKTLSKSGLDALTEVSEVDLPHIPTVRTSVPGRDAAKRRVDAVVKEMKDGNWRSAARFTQSEWADGVARTLPHVTLLLELTNEFADRYAAAKNEAGGLDFSDLERQTLTALRDESSPLGDPQPSAVALAQQRQFRHVLVDEYQDINQLQDMILSLVSRERVGARRSRVQTPNLFCVGDVKQSIYRFRLADPSIFRDRRQRYGDSGDDGGAVIDLQENFRSRSALLDAINAVFGRLMSRETADLDYDQSQGLRAGATYPSSDDNANCFGGAPIELHLLPQQTGGGGASDSATGDEGGEAETLDRSEREAALIAERILTLMGKHGSPAMQVADRDTAGQPITRPIRFGDIVILLRSMQFKADTLVDTLRNAGIAVHSETTTGYFEATEINDVLSLLAVLDNAAQDIPLAALLRSPLAALSQPEDALAKIRLAFPQEPLHAAVAAYKDQRDDALAGELQQVWAQLGRWRKLVRRRPLAEVLWTIYDQSGYLAFCGGLPGGEQRQANLIELHERARQFGTFRRQGLGRFLQFLEKLKNDSDLGQAAIASPAEDVVRVMSIHRSKGLEFPVVIVGDVGKAINFRDAQGTVLADRCGGIGLQVVDLERRVRYPSLASTVLSERLRQQTIAEELRVLYVAMTRAKEHLVLVGTCKAALPDKWIASWSGHQGLLPAATVLSAHTMLDWIGPVAAAAGESVLRLTMHQEGVAVSSTNAADSSAAARLHSLAKLQPIQPEPEIPAAAKQVMDRLCERYKFAPLTRTAAATNVTAEAKPKDGAIGSVEERAILVGQEDGSAEGALSLAEQLLPNPAFFGGARTLTAADRGTATHTVLQYLRFGNAASRSAVDAQVREMVRGRRLTEEMAAAVDVDAILWLMREPVGALLATHEQRLFREVPVTFAKDSPAAAGLAVDVNDQQMVRGRLDVLVPVDDQLVIVDYKTDRAEGEALEQRVALYRGQLELYRFAIERISRKRVRQAVLVFLHPRQCREV